MKFFPSKSDIIERLEPRRLLAGLTGQYYDSVDFTEPKITRTDAVVDFIWPNSPDASMGADGFSVRWRGQVEPQFTEDYTFFVKSDDGVRLWVDGRLVIDNWVLQGPTEKSAKVTLQAGKRYDIRLDYEEIHSGAEVELLWSSPSQPKQIIPSARLFTPPAGLSATYFDNQDFTGPTVTRTDAVVNFDWVAGSPDPAIGADSFSVRWSGVIQPQFSQTYTFTVTADVGAPYRLRVDGQLILDTAGVQDGGDIKLEAGKFYDVQLEYVEVAGVSNVKLEWSSPSQSKQVIPNARLFAAAPTSIPSRRADYTNSVLNADRPDPGVIFADGYYWMVHTMGGPDQGWPLYRSTDLTSWSFQKHLLTTANKPAFMTDAFWAPEIHKINGQFVLTGTSWSQQYGRLVLAIATAPEIDGPYTVQPNPIVADSVSVLDSNIFQDHDGRVYLLWKRDSNAGTGTNGSIRIRELNSAGTAFAAGSVETVILDNSVGGWERNLAEAPWMVRRGGFYYLFYSGGFIDLTYSVGVARGTSPTGPFTRSAANPIITNNSTFGGPGHGGFALDRDGALWHLYHARYQNNPDFGRVQMLDRVIWTADNWVTFGNGETPSTTQQPGPVVNAASGTGRLSFLGDATLADTFRLVRGADSSMLELYTNGVLTRSVPYAELETITLDGRGGNDTLVLDHSRGDAVPGAGVTFLGSGGTDIINVVGLGKGDVFQLRTGQVTFGSGIVTYSTAEQVILDDATAHVRNDPAGSLILTFRDTDATLHTAMRLNGLGLTGDSVVTVAPGGANLLRSAGFALIDNGRLDLTDNDFILDYTGVSPLGTWDGTSYAAMTGQVAAGRITTSRTSGSTPGDASVRGLALANSSQALGLTGTQTATWNGQSVDATTLLIKYTYLGDANLDGEVNADDYALIDFYDPAPSASGYYNGDFNLDGEINADDYALLDYNNHAQTGPL